MTTNAESAYGVTISWNSHEIAELTQIGTPVSVLDMKEVTNNDSGGWKEYIPGLLGVGEFAVKGNFLKGDTDGQISLQTDHAAKTARAITIGKSGSFQWSATAYCTRFKVDDAPQDGTELTFSASFQITGQPTFTVTASTGLTTPFFTTSSGDIVPTPANDAYVYVVSVAIGVSSITVTPTASAGTITVNGNTVTSGEASSAIALGAAGSVTDVTIVVTETGKAPVTYTLHVARAAS